MIIKVCGMRDAENIREVEALGIDWMGFIFWSKSSRYVSKRPTYLPQKCKRVGVFVDATVDDILQHISDYRLDIVQLHGSERPEDVRRLRSLCGDSTAIIKAVNIATKDDLMHTKSYEGVVDYFLFDTKGKSVGGNGEKFDWSVLADYAGNTPFLLSGGIGPDDAARISQTLTLDGFPDEKCAGIDLNSRFETAPAIKDINKLDAFIKKIRHYE
ncbi:MAG: phosphoribosylanthranilate isomerase [Prevotella sp.]|nr:phosphoribosylanthranilate isomerase [Prevotella sp.]MBQ9652558.1 phosphoribosylanthranilate isomerase [Prevotella sp.]